MVQSLVKEQIFKALGDPSRCDIVERLAVRPTTLTELAQPYQMSMSAVLQHVRVLERSGLVRTRKVGRVRSCWLDPRALAEVDHWLTSRRRQLEHRLDRLEALLDTDDRSEVQNAAGADHDDG